MSLLGYVPGLVLVSNLLGGSCSLISSALWSVLNRPRVLVPVPVWWFQVRLDCSEASNLPMVSGRSTSSGYGVDGVLPGWSRPVFWSSRSGALLAGELLPGIGWFLLCQHSVCLTWRDC